MKNIKVAHLTSVHQYNDTRIFHKECKSLYKNGYKVFLVAPHTKNETQDGIKIIAIKKYSNRFLRMTLTTWNIYKISKKLDCDIYHIHDPELIPVGLCLRRFNKKIIYDAHEDVPKQILSKYWLPEIIRKSIAKIFEWFENWATKHFSAIITSTPYIREKFKKTSSVPVVDIKNFPILSFFNQNESNDKQRNYFCYIGSISKERGIYEMLKAVFLTKSQLLLCGKPNKPTLIQELEKLPEWAYVNYKGIIKPNEISNQLRHAIAGFVVLHPIKNHIDSLPVKLFEYMASGIPVIASNFPIIKKIIQTNNCGICVDPLNIDEIQKAMEYLQSNPKEAQKMGENGKNFIKHKYNWSIEEKSLLKLYDILCQKIA